MKLLKLNFGINSIDKNNIKFDYLNNKKINIIDVTFKFTKAFNKITDNSNTYIDECFKTSLELLKTKKFEHCFFLERNFTLAVEKKHL